MHYKNENEKLKEINIEYCTCYYFSDIMKIENFIMKILIFY